MKQPPMKQNFKPGSLQRPRTARTVLLRMAADETRAERIRELYEEAKAIDPRRVTWRRLGDHVGVSERAAHAWSTTGGIDFEHVPKIAEFFAEYRPGVDTDYIWRGPRPRKPPICSRSRHGPISSTRSQDPSMSASPRSRNARKNSSTPSTKSYAWSDSSQGRMSQHRQTTSAVS